METKLFFAIALIVTGSSMLMFFLGKAIGWQSGYGAATNKPRCPEGPPEEWFSGTDYDVVEDVELDSEEEYFRRNDWWKRPKHRNSGPPEWDPRYE
jgi:hypothetical protein